MDVNTGQGMVVDFTILTVGAFVASLTAVGFDLGGYYMADVVSYANDYPFGMQMVGRNGSAPEGPNRYGFNGKETDDLWGAGDGIQDYGFRLYSPALGKFLSVDSLTKNYPMLTPYQFAGNMPIWAADLDGLEPHFSTTDEAQRVATTLNFIF